MMATKVEWRETPARYIRKGDQFQTGSHATVYTALDDPQISSEGSDGSWVDIHISWTEGSVYCRAGSTRYNPRADYILYRKVVTEVPDEPVRKPVLSEGVTLPRTAANLGVAVHALWEEYALTGVLPEGDEETRPFLEQCKSMLGRSSRIKVTRV